MSLKQIVIVSAALTLLMLAVAAGATDEGKRAGTGPDILILGDSQISFGAGRVYNDFFSDIENQCAPYNTHNQALPALKNATVASIGVRSTGLHSWVATDEETKATICKADKVYGVNAGSYGIAGNDNRSFIQIGQGPHYQFCAPERSPFQELFADGYYTPDLLVLAFLGNSWKRWAEDPEVAARDVALTINQIPPNMPCVFMTTVPVFDPMVNRQRRDAQANVKSAFELYGRCSFVEAYTPEIVAKIEGNSQYFKRDGTGKVTDPFHPNPSAVRQFVASNTPQFCNAVFNELKP